VNEQVDEQVDDVGAAFDALGAQVAGQLETAGWHRRRLEHPWSFTFTRPARNGVLAVVDVYRRSFTWPDELPVEVEVALGVGYQPALDLMPLLTVYPRAALIEDPEHGRSHSLTVPLGEPATVPPAGQRIVQFVQQHSAATVQNFPDAAAIEAWMRHALEGADGDSPAPGVDPQLRLVVLAAMGRLAQARALLATHRAARAGNPPDREDLRFVRQLTRWLDAGGPPPPPLEDTLARLPPQRRPRPSRPDARARSKAGKQARDAARARSAGKSLDQLEELITTEYRSHGVELAPSLVTFYAEVLKAEQQPISRARRAFRTVRLLASGGADVVRAVSHHSDDDPAWLRPPKRAAYPALTSRDRFTAVDLDAAAHDWLQQVGAEAPRRIGRFVLLEVWLSQETPEGSLVVHIGERGVGTVPEDEARNYDQILRAAAVFDEDPFLLARLATSTASRPAVLEISLPEPEDGAGS
jgi:hypothetical protein